jgi:asparagine synthase (glutamine-hydrolysing)
MLADVPVGAFLSGGLDSSLVVAALGDGARDLPTFAVGFPEEPGRPSELAIARRAAAILKTDHECQELRAEGYFERLPWAIERTEEPLAHAGILLQADLSALARRRVKVVLTGQGADEPFGGYPRHHAARVLPLVAGLLAGVARSAWVRRWGARREAVARVRRVLTAAPGLERTAALFSPLAPEEAGTLVHGCGPALARDAILHAIRPWWDRAAGMDDVARFLYVDVRTALAEDLLLVGDKMAMVHSLEARVPYLDLQYLAALEAIPGSARVAAWGTRKRIQHAIGRVMLPRELSRELATSSSPLRPKRGFDVPVARWFRGPFREGLRDLLVGPQSLLPAYLDARRLEESVQAYLGGSGRAYRQILAFFALEHWLRSAMAPGRAL